MTAPETGVLVTFSQKIVKVTVNLNGYIYDVQEYTPNDDGTVTLKLKEQDQ